MSKIDLKLDWCSHEAAKYAVEKWHYSGQIPSASIKIGAWENGEFVGVVIFGRGAASEIGSPYKLPQTQICELVRIALRQHKTPVSIIVAIALKMLRRQSPGLRLIVSFSDTAQGHHGGIYQAGGWVFVGSQEYHAYRVNGKLVHPKTLHSVYGVGGQSIPWLRAHVDPKAERVKNGTKHKYLYPLDVDMALQIEPLRKPYPKRADSVTQHACLPAGVGGSTPTSALHLP